MSQRYSPTGPINADSQRDLLAKILQAILAGGGSGGTTQIYGGTGSAAASGITPTASFALWIQTDSVPAYQITGVWANSGWH